MAAELQWIYITDKYAVVEIIDNAIVVARFNQNDLMRELIKIRCKLLESKSYDELILVLDYLLVLNKKIIDKRLAIAVGRLIDRLTSFKDVNQFDYINKMGKIESKALD